MPWSLIMVPKGWKQSKIGMNVDLISGYPFNSESYSENPGDIRLLRGDNIAPGHLRWRDVKRWNYAGNKELEKYKLEVGDIVIAMDRTWIPLGLKVAEVKDYDVPCLLV